MVGDSKHDVRSSYVIFEENQYFSNKNKISKA